MRWNNRVTRLLGCQYPIVLGAMQGIGRSAIAAPVSEAGGLGIITAHWWKPPPRTRSSGPRPSVLPMRGSSPG